MPPSGQDPIDDIWRTIFRKAPITGVTMVIALIIACVSAFGFAGTGYTILAIPYISIPLFLVGGFIVGIVLDSIVGVLRGNYTKRKKKRKPRMRIEDDVS